MFIINLLLCFFVLFAVGSTSGKSITYHNVTFSSDYAVSAEDLLNNVSETVVQFDSSLDEYINWLDFDSMFKEMLVHSGTYSIWSIGDVRKYFLESRDYYFKAVTSVYGWCGEIDVLMTAYLDLFNVYAPEVREAQKMIIINSLDSGIAKMTESLDHLDKSRENLNNGIVGLSNVMSNITETFRHDQSAHEAKIFELNERVMGALEKSVVAGIIRLIMVEAIYKPEARQTFEKIKSSFDFMKKKIWASIDKALEIKKRLLAEIQNVVELQAAAKANKVLMNFNFFTVIKKAATSLKTKCHNYQIKHGSKS